MTVEECDSSLSPTDPRRPFAEHMAVKPSGRSRFIVSQLKKVYTKRIKRNKKQMTQALLSRVAGWEQARRHTQWGLCCLPTGPGHSCLGIVISAWLFIVHRGWLLPTRVLLLFCKKSAWSSGKERQGGRPETFKGEGENGFCQIVCPVPLLFPSSLLKVIGWRLE